MGCASPEYFVPTPDPRRRVRHTPLRFATLLRSISASGEKRWLYQLPPFVGQAVVGGATSASPLNAGAGRIGCACAADARATAASAIAAQRIRTFVSVMASSPRS